MNVDNLLNDVQSPAREIEARESKIFNVLKCLRYELDAII
jgi:hypothetical protein